MMGEMCILHRIVFRQPSPPDKRFVMVSCRPSCPKYERK